MRLLLAFLLAVAAVAAPGLRLEGDPFLPYRINHGVAADEDGLIGTLELLGLRWDGARIPLFRAPVGARSQSVELDFYLDEEFRGLELRIGSERSVSIPLADVGLVDAEEAALRLRMRGLVPPTHISPEARSPQSFQLLGSDPLAAGSLAASELFGLPVSRLPLAPLGVFAAVTLLLSAIPWAVRGRRRIAWGVMAGASIGATLLVVHLGAPRPRVFSVAFPGAGGASRVERRTDEQPAYTRVTYSGAGAGPVELIGLWAPTGTGIPVAEVVPAEARVRFSAPPLIAGEGRFLSRDFVTGWVVHARH